jgi:hypothetical protein
VILGVLKKYISYHRYAITVWYMDEEERKRAKQECLDGGNYLLNAHEIYNLF